MITPHDVFMAWKLGAISTCLAFAIVWNIPFVWEAIKQRVDSAFMEFPPVVMGAALLLSIMWPILAVAFFCGLFRRLTGTRRS